jgi:anti-anti-sigma factor
MAVPFTITFHDHPSQGVELAVTGELDSVTAASLRAALDAVVLDRVVAVNATAITFIDSSGLHALLDADRAIHTAGGRFYLLDPSPAVRRILVLCGLDDHFAGRDLLWSTSDSTTRGPLETHLRGIITDLAGIVLNAASLRADLEQLVEFSCQVVPACSAASIALLVDGTPTTLAVTEHVALELDIVQYDNNEGPCLSALSGERIRVDVVDADERFPHFAIGATDRRVHSVLSMPIVHDDDVIGTLNLYSNEPEAFDETAEDIARLTSSQAAQAIARSAILTGARHRRDQLQAHYDQSVLVARAQGVLIATQRCSAEQARNLLANAASATGDTLLTIAERILDHARHHTGGSLR